MAFRVVEPVWLAEIVMVPAPGAAARVVTVKVPVVEPAATVIVAGTVPTAVLLLNRLTANPPVGAAPEIVTVPVEEAGCVTLVGLSASFDIVGGFTVRVALWGMPFVEAEIEAGVDTPTGVVVMVKVADVSPPATMTLVGTVAAALLLARVTVNPPVGACVSILTVPVDVAPPITVPGASVTDATFGGVISKAPVTVAFNVAVIVSIVKTATGLVSTTKVAVVSPAATVTLAGTVPPGELADRVTFRCAAVPPAGPLSVTVPVEFTTLPSTIAGLMTTEMTDGGITVSVAACAVVEPTFAEIESVVDTPTASGVTLNVVDVAFAGTVTLAGTVATLVVALVNFTTVPPDGAAPFNVTVPVEV